MENVLEQKYFLRMSRIFNVNTYVIMHIILLQLFFGNLSANPCNTALSAIRNEVQQSVANIQPQSLSRRTLPISALRLSQSANQRSQSAQPISQSISATNQPINPISRSANQPAPEAMPLGPTTNAI